jgi:acetyltransferase-like isoleucine patch superfamily enzyme
MGGFKFIHKIRNKIRIAKTTELSIANNVKLVGCKITVRGENNRIEIEEGVKIHRSIIEIMGRNCLVKIGKGSMVGDACYLMTKENGTEVIIGEGCSLSRNVKVMASDGHPIFREGKRINEARSILLGKHIWVADNVTILKGVSIGSGAVVGINSTVTKDIPKNVVAVGNPARVVQEGIEWRDKF